VSTVVFVDANIPMYLVGADDRYRTDARRLVERAVEARERLVTNAEVLQEILHRYTAINQRDAILGVVDEVFSITADDVERAKNIVQGRRKHSARDAIHLATMERHRVSRIMTFDKGFDSYPGVTRVTV
jgi:predicted nucleic acid-binding protein